MEHLISIVRIMYSKDIREIAVRLYNHLNSLRRVSKFINSSHSTISRWLITIEINQRNTKRKILETPIIIDAIKLFLEQKPFSTLKDTRQLIKDNFDVSVSTELIRLVIKNTINFSRKRARYFSIPKNDQEKLETFLNKRQQYISENRNFISIDETSFGRHIYPSFGYSKRNTRLNIKRPNVNITTHSACTAISKNHSVQYKLIKGSFDSEKFRDFLETLHFPPKTVILMDNVSFHHSKIVKELVDLREWDILFVPPYSPVFNPIEGVFSIVKRHFYRYQNIQEAFESVTNNHIVSFFNGAFNAKNRTS